MLVWYVGVHWIYLAQDRTYWQALVKNMMYSEKDRKYLDLLVTSSYSKRIAFHLFSCSPTDFYNVQEY